MKGKPMRKIWLALLLGCCALAVYLWAETPKAGLYEVTTVTTWQPSPFPAGMDPGTHPQTTQICVTQQQIDTYQGIPPQSNRNCNYSNLVKKPNGFSADIVCNRGMDMRGTIDSISDEQGGAKIKIRMNGTINAGSGPKQIEMTALSDAKFKGSDCGSVKPADPPK